MGKHRKSVVLAVVILFCMVFLLIGKNNNTDAGMIMAVNSIENGVMSNITDNIMSIDITFATIEEETEHVEEMEHVEETDVTSDATSEEVTEVIPDYMEDDNLVSNLSVAKQTNQLIIVSATGNQAIVSMHQKSDAGWQCILETTAQIGANGVGKTKEGDRKTPRGVYTMSFAFGNDENPGTMLPYTQTDASWYWVDDAASKYYNQFVSTQNVTADWTSAEHIAGVKQSYNYVIPIDYNTTCTPGAGSAIFLHCKPSGGAGCIAVDQDAMITILKNIQAGCLIVIDTEENISTY